MQQHESQQATIQREAAIDRYVQALDTGDLDTVATVLDLAVSDGELARILREINRYYQEEEGIVPLGGAAQRVRDLLYLYLPVPTEAEQTTAVTVGEVAAHLEKSGSLTGADQAAQHQLLDNPHPIPARPTGVAIRKLAGELGVAASDAFWSTFREAAILLGLRRSRQRMVATRPQRQAPPPKPGAAETPTPEEEKA